MGRKLESTPKSRIKNALRQVWLRSRERAKALKSTGNRCCKCGVKAIVAKGREVKLEVHHDPPILWDGVVQLIYDRLLNVPQFPMCHDCHQQIHDKEKANEDGQI
jgi:predicted HNH restriction endonuclease